MRHPCSAGLLIRRAASCQLLRRELSGLATTRNVGIIAHIDAGKTTTTERMLLLAGMTRSAGGVDTGDTVMDFMEQERERGITIQAAATRFDWTAAAAATRFGICLIDTPGHVDFTIEVERTTRVLDGAVLIVDAVAGAQAQTETVWRQARSHGVPAVAFINKMDREGARFDAALASLRQRLNIMPLAVQLPLTTAEGIVGGAVDLIEMEALVYRPSEAKQGGRAQRGAALTLMHGEETVDLQSVGPGAICAAVGLRHTRTGDTLVVRPAAEWAEIALQPVLRVPTPVFFTAVEVGSAVQQPALDAALEALCLEDPSLVVRLDPTTGQQLLGGMGELHLEVVAERIRREHKLELYTGPMQGTAPDALRKACAEALPAAAEQAAPVLLEPLMAVELRAPEKHVGAVLRELTGKRRGDVLELISPAECGQSADERHVVHAEVPLSALVGYANALRSLTQGEVALTMEFSRYRPSTDHDG
ncbi:translation elongation factor g [Chrysochromulina tobinii]|uniref:Translation elongation factor g n=1 Tax=Chrysochromulina tobinii TaxID=1460289 RepID=A0A0M0JLX8_9EUKA|nr:translation elongation factor g [Chrysochromulina tobinii]|eukprot:KOO27470.1 translation elongation factor g [Chrysochromulina sp. CCMP291]